MLTMINKQLHCEVPDVWVLARDNFSQMGSVTYLATRECLDLMSGKGSDMVTVAEGRWLEAAERRLKVWRILVCKESPLTGLTHTVGQYN